MATIYKRNGKWGVQIRQAGFKDISEAFPSKKDTNAFAKITEAKRIRGTYEAKAAVTNNPLPIELSASNNNILFFHSSLLTLQRALQFWLI